jgi:hypothetical protein
VDGKVPFPPIFGKVASIPPIVIETPICKASEFSPKVHVRVKERVENHEPEIRGRYTHVESLVENFEVVFLSERLDRCLSYWKHMLID